MEVCQSKAPDIQPGINPEWKQDGSRWTFHFDQAKPKFSEKQPYLAGITFFRQFLTRVKMYSSFDPP
jgi:hypothetical protein